jgi:peptidoglycan hydrolase CwlO-like protein
MPPPAVVSPVGVDEDAPTALTSHDAPDGLPAAPPVLASGNATGSVRLPDSLPRKSGITGDIAYLFRVWAKNRSSKIEMARLATLIASEKETRNLKLLQVARQAIGDDRNDQTLVGRARVSLLEIEERRSLHAGRVAAADEKMSALGRHRSTKHEHRIEEGEALRNEVETINASLEPLQTRAANARKRTTEHRKQLKNLDEKIRQEEASLVAVAGPADKAAVHASIASLRAERDTVAADEPMLAAEVDDLDPKISSLISTRSGLADKIVALDQERELDEVRVKEKEEAVKASRTVESRAVDDQANKRQDALLELGEALHNKPVEDAPRVSSIEKHDLEIGTLERRRLELKELMSSVEYLPMIRGGIWLVLAALAIGGAVFFALSR